MNCGKNDEHILKCSEKCGSSPRNIWSPFEAIHILNGFTKFPDLSFIFGFNTLQDITSTLYRSKLRTGWDRNQTWLTSWVFFHAMPNNISVPNMCICQCGFHKMHGFQYNNGLILDSHFRKPPHNVVYIHIENHHTYNTRVLNITTFYTPFPYRYDAMICTSHPAL
jgi:hypothetical protein